MIPENELRRIPLLSELDSEELLNLGRLLRPRSVPKGSFIVYVDDPGSSMMFIVEGSVKISLASEDGKEIILATLSQGEFFGEISLLTGDNRSANVIAAADCKLLVLYEEDFKQHLLKNFGLSYAMLRELAVRLRASSDKIGDLALYDVYRRVARTLKSLAKPSAEDGTLEIADRPTHQELASMVGTSREMVTRALKGLEEDECIKVEGKRILVLGMPL